LHLPQLINYKPGEKWQWELDAAEAIEQVDDTHIKFRLKPGLKWSGDYGEVSAEDVKYSFERIADPKNESPYKDDFAVLDKVEVTDKLSGTIVLKEYFAPLWTSTLPWGSGKIVCKAAVEKAGGKFTTEIPAASGPLHHQGMGPETADPSWPAIPLMRSRDLFRRDPNPPDRRREDGRDRLRSGRRRLHRRVVEFLVAVQGKPAGAWPSCRSRPRSPMCGSA
jgi:hypothetical protein